MNKLVIYLVAVLLIVMAFLSGYTGFFVAPSEPTDNPDIKTFIESGSTVCDQNEKPVIRMYSTTTCPHCNWIKETYDSVVKEYVDAGKIMAYHWEYKTSEGVWDDTLTDEIEGIIPKSELDIFDQFGEKNKIPKYVFGCKYYRIGNGKQQDLAAEEAEFRTVIEELIK